MVDLNLSQGVQEKILDLAKQYGANKLSVKTKESIETHQKESEEKELRQELQHLARQYNDEMKKLNTSVSFSYDDRIEGLLVIVKEGDSEKVIREIPSKEAIKLMKKMQDLVGLIFNKKA